MSSKQPLTDSVKSIRSYASVSIPEAYHLYNLKVTEGKAILHADGDNGFISVYSYPRFELLYRFGRTGQGPDEFITNNWGDSVWVIDTDGNLLYRLQLEHKVNLIAIDEAGRMVAYKKMPESSQFYLYSLR